jgi:hypothetical protein
MTSLGLSTYASVVDTRNPPVLEKFLTPARTTTETTARLNINVVFTSVNATLAALKAAGTLANHLAAHITLVVLQIVPYPLPLTSPPVSVDWNERRFRVVANESSVETLIHMYLCRDRCETLMSVLKPRSLVVIGGRRRWWWPTPEKALARTLRRAGHEVIYAGTE